MPVKTIGVVFTRRIEVTDRVFLQERTGFQISYGTQVQIARIRKFPKQFDSAVAVILILLGQGKDGVQTNVRLHCLYVRKAEPDGVSSEKGMFTCAYARVLDQAGRIRRVNSEKKQVGTFFSPGRESRVIAEVILFKKKLECFGSFPLEMLNEGLVQGNIIILRFWRSRNGVLWLTAIAREYWGVPLSAGNCT